MTIGTHQTPTKCTFTFGLENVSLKRWAIFDELSASCAFRHFHNPFLLFDQSFSNDWFFFCGFPSFSCELSFCFFELSFIFIESLSSIHELSFFCEYSVFGGGESSFGDLSLDCDARPCERSAYNSYALGKISSNTGKHKIPYEHTMESVLHFLAK